MEGYGYDDGNAVKKTKGSAARQGYDPCEEDKGKCQISENLKCLTSAGLGQEEKEFEGEDCEESGQGAILTPVAKKLLVEIIPL